MIIRAWINIIFLSFCAYGALGVLNETIPVYRVSEFLFVLYMIAPWALLYGSIKSWHQCFVWRRMLAKRQTPPVLSRGQYRSEKSLARTSILEQFSITHIEWWIGSLIGAYFALRMVIKRVK